MVSVIDSHLHIWDPRRVHYPWLKPHLSRIDRPFDIADATDQLTAAGVDGVVLVQAADDFRDTELMLSAYDATPAVVGVVAWAPLDDVGMPGIADGFAADPRVLGVRSLIHDRQDDAWLFTPNVSAGFRELERAGLTFDFVTSDPDALAHIPELASRFPGLRIIIDHLGKPELDAGHDRFEAWKGLLTRAAAAPNVSCKLSGLRWPAPAESDAELARPFVEHALTAFGADRLMYGGDWPVSTLHGAYARTLDALAELVEDLKGACDRIFRTTAASIYSIDHERLTAATAGEETT